MQHIWRKSRSYFHQNLKSVKIFGPTAEEIAQDVNFSDKVCLITGASSGIGLEVTRCLISIDCNVLMASRNPYVARTAARHDCKKFDRLRFYEVNLASLASVQKLIKSLLHSQKRIDVVILNAATFGLPWTLTEDGLETIFQVNFLSQYYLLLSIEKILAPNARVVFTSSESHRNVKLSEGAQVFPSIDDLSLPAENYTSIRAYNLSKLCGVLAARYLHYRWGQAASTILYCATSPELAGQSGYYFKDCKQCEPSELASSTHLSYRIHDLACDVLRQKHFDCDLHAASNSVHETERGLAESELSNY